jgi:hypothetical protein
MSTAWYERHKGGYAWTQGKFRSAKLTKEQRKLLDRLTFEAMAEGEKAEFLAIVGYVNCTGVEEHLDALPVTTKIRSEYRAHRGDVDMEVPMTGFSASQIRGAVNRLVKQGKVAKVRLQDNTNAYLTAEAFKNDPTFEHLRRRQETNIGTDAAHDKVKRALARWGIRAEIIQRNTKSDDKGIELYLNWKEALDLADVLMRGDLR